MSLGRALGQGQTLAEIMGGRRAVTEGVATAQAVKRLAGELQVDMPICRAVSASLDGSVSVDSAISGLLQRPLQAED